MRHPKKLQCCLFLGCAVLLLKDGRLGATVGHVYDDCGQVCWEGADCDLDCTSYGDEPFNTTCGDYSGGGADGFCIGSCGDGYCNQYEYENNPSNDNFCLADCHACGDGVCSGQYGENCATCPTDCDQEYDGCETEVGGGSPGDSCGDGGVQNGDGYCCESFSGPYPDDHCDNALCIAPDESCVVNRAGNTSWCASNGSSGACFDEVAKS